MSLCADGKHKWDAQVALRKGGVEVGDPCDCRQVEFGMHAFPNLGADVYQLTKDLARHHAVLPLGLPDATGEGA